MQGKARKSPRARFTAAHLTPGDVIALLRATGWTDEAMILRVDAPAISAACNRAGGHYQRHQAAINELSNLRDLARAARNNTDRAVFGLRDLVAEVRTWTDAEKQQAEFARLEAFSTEFAERWARLRPVLVSLRREGGQSKPWTCLVRRLTDHLDLSLGAAFPTTYDGPGVRLITALVAATFPPQGDDDDRTEAIAKLIGRHRSARVNKSAAT